MSENIFSLQSTLSKSSWQSKVVGIGTLLLFGEAIFVMVLDWRGVMTLRGAVKIHTIKNGKILSCISILVVRECLLTRGFQPRAARAQARGCAGTFLTTWKTGNAAATFSNSASGEREQHLLSHERGALSSSAWNPDHVSPDRCPIYAQCRMVPQVLSSKPYHPPVTSASRWSARVSRAHHKMLVVAQTRQPPGYLL